MPKISPTCFLGQDSGKRERPKTVTICDADVLCASQVLPEVALTLLMVMLLVATADRTLRKGIKAYKKETGQLKVLQACIRDAVAL